ncbi:hypothetical protein GBA52_010404 [Prunus armeniaca]|nr:hypothetical protein GBA52_010404 [Prunus armeniaca]
MTWILGSVEPNIILNLRSSQTAAQMWTYLKKIYSQQNIARWFQLEHELAAFQQDSLSISDFYSRFTNLWAEYTDIVYADLPSEGLSSVQSIHETTQRDQFLMKLRPEFEGTRSNLMNRESVPSLDTCLNDLLREEQRLLTQTTKEQRRSASVPVAYAAQGKPRGRDMSTVHVFVARDLVIMLQIVPENSATTAKRMAISSRNVLLDPPRNQRPHILSLLAFLVLEVL